MYRRLKTIITHCKAIEASSRDIYRTFEKKSDSEEEKQLWLNLAKDEAAHIAFWDKLQQHISKKHLKNPFDKIDRTLHQMEQLIRVFDEIKTASKEILDTKDRIRQAFTIENLILHPSFTILFRAANIQVKERTPEDDYQDHIDRLIQFAGLHLSDVESSLYSISLQSSYQRSIEIANLIDRIDSLEGLISICAWCKKILDDSGKWVRIEDYIVAHSRTHFSHGVCDDCKHKI